MLLKLDNPLKALFVVIGILLEEALFIAIFKVLTDINGFPEKLDKFDSKGGD